MLECCFQKLVLLVGPPLIAVVKVDDDHLQNNDKVMFLDLSKNGFSELAGVHLGRVLGKKKLMRLFTYHSELIPWQAHTQTCLFRKYNNCTHEKVQLNIKQGRFLLNVTATCVTQR